MSLIFAPFTPEEKLIFQKKYQFSMNITARVNQGMVERNNLPKIFF